MNYISLSDINLDHTPIIHLCYYESVSHVRVLAADVANVTVFTYEERARWLATGYLVVLAPLDSIRKKYRFKNFYTSK